MRRDYLRSLLVIISLSFFLLFSSLSVFAAPSDIVQGAPTGLNASASLVVGGEDDHPVYFFGDVKGQFCALDEFGRVLAQIDLGGAITSSAALDQHGNIYIGTRNNQLIALEFQTDSYAFESLWVASTF